MSKLPNLLQLVFTAQHVVALPDHKQEETPEIKFSHEVSFAQHDDDPQKLMLEVALESDDKESINAPYKFRIACFVALQLPAPEPDDDDVLEKAKLLGAQIGVGAIRDHLATMTARAPWGGLLLPPFVPKVPSSEPKTESEDTHNRTSDDDSK